MKFRTHDGDQQRAQHPTEPHGAQGPNGAAAGAEFLAAADEAIARIMSGDAESFLRANRQQGGE